MAMALVVATNTPSGADGRMRAAIKEWSIRGGLMIGSLAFALAIAEMIVRIFLPIYGGRDNLALDGRRIGNFLHPGIVYRQVSNEYDALTTITDKGHRAPSVAGSPDVVFVGDSFTFGWGLEDDETFASIYCERRQLECANLGMPGSGTSRQVRRLQAFLDRWQWRPRQVKLFFFGMSSSFSSGNDFNENYDYERRLQASGRANQGNKPEDSIGEPRQPGIGGRIIDDWQTTLLDHMHLMRRAKYHWGPLLRSLLLAVPDDQRRVEALMYTERAFKDLDELSRRVGFEYEIYLIVPAHDMLLGTHPDTLAMLNSVAPKPAIPTAPLFVDAPRAFYFPYDGHLNPKGSRRVAEFLITRDGRTDGSR